MGYRIVSLILVAFMVTGFSWGSKKKEKKAPVRTSSYSSSNYTSSAASSVPAAATTTQAGAAGAGGETFPSELIGALAKGSEEERQARIESLKRLSVALSEMKQKNTSVEAASSAESAQQTSWRTSY